MGIEGLFIAIIMYGGLAYMVSIGIGMVIAGSRGAKRAHTWWVKFVTRLIAKVFDAAADLLHWIATSVRR